MELASLNTVLAGYTEIAQQRWLTWLKKQQLDTMVPKEFSAVLDIVIVFADPVITGKTIAAVCMTILLEAVGSVESGPGRCIVKTL